MYWKHRYQSRRRDWLFQTYSGNRSARELQGERQQGPTEIYSQLKHYASKALTCSRTFKPTTNQKHRGSLGSLGDLPSSRDFRS